MLNVFNKAQQNPAMKRAGNKTPSLSENKRMEKLRALHKTLTNEWKLKCPDVRRILMSQHKSPASKKKQVFLSIDPFAGEDKLSLLKKGTANMQKMTRHEQMHKLQSAIQERIMVHKYNDKMSVIYISQIKAIQKLMEFMNRQLEILCRMMSLKVDTTTLPQKSFDSFIELTPSVLIILSENFYRARKLSRTIDDKILLTHKLGEGVPSSEISLLRKSKRETLVDKLFEDGTDKIVEDFPFVLRENDTDIYFLLGFSPCPSVKQLLSSFRNVHHLSLNDEQQMYHIFRLSVLSKILIDRAYAPKCLL